MQTTEPSATAATPATPPVAESTAISAPFAVNGEQKSLISLPTGVLDIAHDSHSSRAYAACMDGVYEVDLETQRVTRLHEHQSYVSSVAVIPECDTLLSAGYDGQLVWYDLKRRTVYRRIHAHQFWSWDMCVSLDGRLVASVTGQYLAGAQDYSPLPEREPSVRIYDVRTGNPLHALPHVPSVQAVAFTPDSRYVAAGNLMGEVRIWDTKDGQQVAQWTTDDLTSWGIIKSHCYLGGIFAMEFSADGEHLLVAGMGPMKDPMAGNGRQLWQKFAWRETPAQRVDQTHEGESGEGLMETLAVHQRTGHFLMGGRLRGGDWNAALFDGKDGRRLQHLNTGYRITSSQFTASGDRLLIAGADRQPAPKDGQYAAFGKLEIYPVG